MKKKAFSLAEMLVVMLILTIVLAATMPILSKRAKYKAAAGVSLPSATQGGTCTASANSLAIDASTSTLLTCQGGTWKKPPSGGGGGETLYLYGDGCFHTCGYYTCPDVPATCPSGWSDGGIGAITGENISYYGLTTPTITVRSCYKCS